MTTPGAVGEQMMLAKVTAKPQHGGPRQSAGSTSSEAETEFSDLLNTMQQGGGREQTSSTAGAIEAEEPSRQVERKSARADAGKRHERSGDADLRAAIDLLSYGKAGGADEPAREEDVSEQSQPHGRTDGHQKLDAIAAKADDARAIAFANVGQPPEPAQAPQESRAPLPNASNTAGEANQWAETRMAGQVARPGQTKVEQKDEGRSPADADFAGAVEATDAGASEATATKQAPREDLPEAKVLRQEAHFAPVASSKTTERSAVAPAANAKPGSEVKKAIEPAPASVDMSATEQPLSSAPARPAQQIADQIAAEVSSFESAGGVRPDASQAAPAPMLKVLQIQLQPADLGTVTVRLELRQDELEVHVETSSAETADLIRGDKDTLSNLLRASGYAVDHNAIRIVEGDRSAVATQLGQQGTQPNLQSSTQSQSGWSQRGEGSHPDHQGAKNGNAQVPESREPHGTTSHRVSGSLYI